jgi:hypothetical protein
VFIINFVFETLGIVLVIGTIAIFFLAVERGFEGLALFILGGVPLVFVLYSVLDGARDLAKDAYAWVACDEDELRSLMLLYSDHIKEGRSIDLAGAMGHQVARDYLDREARLTDALREETESCRIDYGSLQIPLR